MRSDVLEWGRSVLTAEVVEDKRVLEVGSMNVNGSLRTYVESLKPEYYVGIDIAMGPGVDRVLNVNRLIEAYGKKKWDLVICTEMLEHCSEWQGAVYEMKESLDVGGSLLITTVGPGFPNHDWPGDYWRFTQVVMEEALIDLNAQIYIKDVPEPAVFALGTRHSDEVYYPRAIALPAPTKEENSSEIMVWPELDRMLANAVHAVKNGKLDPQIVRQAFERFNRGIV